MNQEIWILLNFLKDKLSLLLLFVINTAVIILFFNLSLGSDEWLYPGAISAVIFLPYLFIRYFNYRKLIHMAETSEGSAPDEMYSGKEYIRKINSAFIKIHKNYNIRLNEEKQNNVEFRRFISQFIHAMKTPVTVINLAVQKGESLIAGQEEEENDENGEFAGVLEDISGENQRQLDMLNNILDYLRIKEFSRDYTPVPADLYQELTKVINGRKRSFIYHNIRPELLSNGGGKAEILTDLKWNAVMLDQIISNAVKYSGSADEMKKIDFSIDILANKTVLSIRDYGIGIPEHDMPKLAEPFFTGENGRKMKGATGIGLYMVKLISESLGHEVDIRSQPGAGTTVSIIYHKLKL